MAIRIEAELNANTKQAQKEVNELNEKVKEVGKSAKKSGQAISSDLAVAKPIIRELDRYSGGLATKLIDVGKAAKLSGKAMKSALVSTGIGALVVALALVVEYWDEISSLIDGVSNEQEDLLLNTQDTLTTQQKQLDIIGSMENTLKLQGKSEKEIRNLKRQQTNEIIASTELLLEQQKQTKKSQVEAAERNKKIASGIIAFLSLPITILLGAVDALTAGLAQIGVIEEATNLAEGYIDGVAGLIFNPEAVTEEADKTIEETEKQLARLKNQRDGFILQDKADRKKASEDKNRTEEEEARKKAEALESIRKTLIDTEAEERAEKLRLIKADYAEQIRLAELYYGEDTEKVKELKKAQRLALKEQQAEFDQEDEETRLKEEARLKKINDDEWNRLQKQYDDERDLEKQKIKDKAMVVDAISQFADAESGVGKALLIVKQGLALQETIMDLKRITFKATNAVAETGVATAENVAQSSKIGFPQNVITIAGAIAQGIGIISSVKKAVSKTKARVSSDVPIPSISSPAPASLPPAFNIVGASGTNQLADAIGGQSQQPIQAYVVSGEVTTAQELDRNIINDASIGG